MKIENKAVSVSRRGRDDGEWSEFLAAVPKLKVGQSVVVKRSASHYRLAMSIAREWLGIVLTARTEGEATRIGRVE